MDQLASNYMVMCKVESSTDSESEMSARCSGSSGVVCASCAPDIPTFRKSSPLTHTYSLSLDPYDGSSEDSEESHVNKEFLSGRIRKQDRGRRGSVFLSRNRKSNDNQPAPAALREVLKNRMRNQVALEQQHILDVQMKCASDSALWVCELDSKTNYCGKFNDAIDSTTQAMDIEIQHRFDDSGLYATTSSTPQTPGHVTNLEHISSQAPESSPDRSPGPYNLRSLYKRKLGAPGIEVSELGQGKRQCVMNMEESASEPC